MLLNHQHQKTRHYQQQDGGPNPTVTGTGSTSTPTISVPNINVSNSNQQQQQQQEIQFLPTTTEQSNTQPDRLRKVLYDENDTNNSDDSHNKNLPIRTNNYNDKTVMIRKIHTDQRNNNNDTSKENSINSTTIGEASTTKRDVEPRLYIRTQHRLSTLYVVPPQEVQENVRKAILQTSKATTAITTKASNSNNNRNAFNDDNNIDDDDDAFSLLLEQSKNTTLQKQPQQHEQPSRRPLLPRSDARGNDIMAGYHFLERNMGQRFVFNNMNNKDDDDDDDQDSTCSSTDNITDSESSLNNNNSNKLDSGKNNKRILQPLGKLNTKGIISTNVDDIDEIGPLYRYFEEFVVKRIEKQKRRYKKGQRKQNNVTNFTCTDKINMDYTHAVKMYCEKKQKETEISINSAASIQTERYDNTSASAMKKKIRPPTSARIDDFTLDSHLFAASHIVQQLLNVVGIIHTANKVFTKPSEDTVIHKSPLEVIYGDIEKYLLTQLSLVGTSDIPSLSPEQATKLIRWYHMFIETVEELVLQNNNNTDIKTGTGSTNPPTNSLGISAVWKSDTERLLRHYLELAVRKVMTVLLDRMDTTDYSNDSEQDVRETNTGQMVTCLPEEIMYIVDLQVQVAVENLERTEYIIQVFQTCLEIISTFVATKMVQIQTQWQAISTKRYCAIINDASRLSDLLDDYRAALAEKYDPSSSKTLVGSSTRSATSKYWDRLDKKIDKVGCELAQLAMLANDYLCRHILHRLESPDPIITSIGSGLWEADTTNGVVEVAVRSLREYFTSVEQWICSVDYYFPKVLQKCFHLTIQSYVESFYRNTIQNGIKHPKMVSILLKNDYMIFTKFFNSPIFEAHTRAAGLLNNQDINAQLLLLLSISRLIDPSISPSDLVDDTRNVLEGVTTAGGTDGNGSNSNATAILHLVGLRGLRSKNDSIKWVRDIARAEQMIQESPQKLKSVTSSSSQQGVRRIQLPDLQNSPYVYAIRVTQNDLQREFSLGSRAYAQNTKDIVSGGGYKKQFQMYVARKQTKIHHHHNTTSTATTTTTSTVISSTMTTAATSITSTTNTILEGYRSNRDKLSKHLFFRKSGNGGGDSPNADEK